MSNKPGPNTKTTSVHPRIRPIRHMEHPALHHILSPLFFFYKDRQGAIPGSQYQVIEGQNMPEPYRHLLVHDGDMTPTLEKFHGCELKLEAITCQKQQSPGGQLTRLRRQVILRCREKGCPVEFGAIEIFVDQFPAWAQDAIDQCQTPLGTILGQWESSTKAPNQLRHHSRPSGFFQVHANQAIATYLKASLGTQLWGRTNQLLTGEGILLANVVEILSPINQERSR